MKPDLTNLEKGPSPEKGAEQTFEQRDHPVEQPVVAERPQPTIQVPSLPSEPVNPAPLADETPQVKEIKSVLSEDLVEIFAEMPEADKQAFRIQGAATVRQIDSLLNGLKVQAGKIADLIRSWLMLIPGINRFFLEQEIKIKTDKILNLKK